MNVVQLVEVYDHIGMCVCALQSLQDPFATHLMIDGLEPHEEYELSLQSVNMYTLRSGSDITRQFLFWFQFETGPGGNACVLLVNL